MAPNPNNRTVDKMLQELDELYKKYWVDYKKQNEPYDKLFGELEKYRRVKKQKELIIAVQSKINSKETFSNLEISIWGFLFTAVGLFLTMTCDLILSNYESLNFFNSLHPSVYVAVVMVLTCMIIVLYCTSVGNERKKSREKCYYSFVYNYLTQIVEQ